MCGIAGFVRLEAVRWERAELLAAVHRMSDAIRHRGPDDYGAWIDENLGIAIGHRRLSIIDLSEHGRQPMSSESGRFVISYNGEVYNFLEIKGELDRHGRIAWRSETDTEVVLEAVERWGVDKAVSTFNGMFAFAVWDRSEGVLTLVRDRMGKKPLYYGFHGNMLLFGSEIKALEACPGFAGTIDRDALAMLLRHNYIPSPRSIYQGIHKLPAASMVQFNLDRMRNGRLSGKVCNGDLFDESVRRYWSVGSILEAGAATPFQGSEPEAINRLDGLLRESVSRRLLSDVPLGAFLSGGVDSSLVVAVMQQISDRPVKTFSIGYARDHEDEAVFARGVSDYLGTEHTDIYVEPEEVLKTIPELGGICDEPLGDTAMIPTYLLAATAVRQVTVALSGDGGDETFAGYRRYLHAEESWRQASRRFGWVPARMRRALSGGLTALAETQWSHNPALWGREFVSSASGYSFRRRIHDLHRLVGITSPERIHEDIMHWKKPCDAVKGGSPYPTVLSDPTRWLKVKDNVQKLVYLDMESRLPDSILAKVDRASMSASLEVRAPLLDRRVVEFAATVPTSMKIASGTGKWLLRELLYQYVPRTLVDRPKKGFSMPIANWLRGPLRSWAEDLLEEGRLKREGFFEPSLIRRRWRDHLDGKRNRHYELWDVLMFQSWLDSRK